MCRRHTSSLHTATHSALRNYKCMFLCQMNGCSSCVGATRKLTHDRLLGTWERHCNAVTVRGRTVLKGTTQPRCVHTAAHRHMQRQHSALHFFSKVSGDDDHAPFVNTSSKLIN